jgi:hypothetical protein
VLWPISFFNEDLTDSLFGFGPAFGNFKVPVIVVVIGCLAIWIGVRVTNRWKRERERAIELDEGKARVQNFLADRKRWIIGLSLVALFLMGESAKNYITYDKQFNKADRSVTGHVIESDPGTPGHAGPDGDPGDPAWSHYQFKVNGITYDGGMKDELPEGEEILIRYNSSDPKFNHAQDDHTTFRDYNESVFFLLILVLAALAWFIWHRKPDEPEPEIDIGDGSFESLRRAMVERLHREPTAKEEAKLRELADGIQKATEEERVAMQKLSEAIERRLVND